MSHLDNMFKSVKAKSTFDNYHQIIVRGLLEKAIEDGLINPEGKSADEVKKEFIKYLSPIGSGKVKFRYVVDHTTSLLSEARIYFQMKKYYFSCLFYATWVEHWFNKMIRSYSLKKGFSDSEIKNIMKDVSLRGKVTWLMRMIGLPSINSKHCKAILDLASLRNGYVHYKWDDKDITGAKDDVKRIELQISSFEKTINYLKRYERKHLFADKKLITRKIVKKIV